MEVNKQIVEQNGNQSAKVMAEYVEQGGGGGGGTTDYNDLHNLPSINGVTLEGDKTPEQLGLNNYSSLNDKPQINGVELDGDKTGEELGLDDVKYVSTFDGVTGDPDKLYFLDTKYDTYKVGFYRFIPASDANPARFERTNPSVVKYVSTFAGVTGDTESLYYLDTKYSTYKVGFYRYIEVEEAGVIVGRFVPIGSLVLVEEVTYAELKALRDNAKLTAGMNYRITDYQCTTTQTDTQSANHPFDIIVTADSASTLNEEARAALHEGDTYFANNDLTAWKLKYCLDNDTSRFSWADTTNGKGVVYYMKDEFDNECPYDFKNVQFKRFKVTDGAGSVPYNHNGLFVAVAIPSELSFNYPDSIVVQDDFIFAYTFSSDVTGGEQTDTSLSYANNVYGNVFKPIGVDLPDNVCFGDTIFGNNLGIAEKNTFRRESYLNNFQRCRYNIFGGRLFVNTFASTYGNVSRRNLCNCTSSGRLIGNDFWKDATFCAGDGFNYNLFKHFFFNNLVGIEVSNNVFERNFQRSSIQEKVTNNKFGRMDYCVIGAGVSHIYTRTTTSLMSNKIVLPRTTGTEQEPLYVGFSANANVQFACKRTDGTLRIWNPADEFEESTIIDVAVLPTTDIDTDALYRLTTTHYYHNDTELADAPQGYKSLNEEALVADENGLTAIEGETATTTPWADVTDAMIATLVSGSLVAACEFGEAGFFKTDADEYDYAANFSTADTYTLWHNATGEPTDWVEVGSVSSLVTDGETTEDVDGELRANAIVDVTALPTTGIKAKTLYRMFVDRYYEDGNVLPSVPTGYVSNRPAIVIIDENGITDDGTLYPWADLDDDQMYRFLTRSQIKEVPAAELMATSTCFKTAANHYVYKDHVTNEQVYELYHNPTATAGEFVKIGDDGSAEVDDVTTQEVDGKLQANAIIEVQTLPATGYKQNSLYRMLDTATQTFKRYYYNGSTDPLPETPTFYKGDGEHLVFGADGYTLNGNPGSYSNITQITLSVWMNNGWVSETTDFSEAGMFRVPGGLAVYDSTTKLTEEDYVVTAEMDKVFKRVQGGWECVSYIQLDKEQYDILSEAQKNDGTLYIVNDEED